MWLALLEAVAAGGIVLWLLFLAVRPTRRLRVIVLPALLAVALGVTVAQPFGFRADAVHGPLQGGTAVDPLTAHRAGPWHLQLHRRDDWWPRENAPIATLQVSSSIVGFLLSGDSTIAHICGNGSAACWDPGGPALTGLPTDAYREPNLEAHAVSLVRTGLPIGSPFAESGRSPQAERESARTSLVQRPGSCRRALSRSPALPTGSSAWRSSLPPSPARGGPEERNRERCIPCKKHDYCFLSKPVTCVPGRPRSHRRQAESDHRDREGEIAARDSVDPRRPQSVPVELRPGECQKSN